MKKVLLVGILAVALSTSMFAQDIPQTNVAQPTAVVEGGIFRVSNYNQLTEEQKSELRSLRQRFEQKQATIQLDIKEINLKIHREMLRGTPDLETINNLIDNKFNLISQMEKNTFEVMFKVNDLL